MASIKLYFVFLIIALLSHQIAAQCPSFGGSDKRWSTTYASAATGDNITIDAATTMWFDVQSTPVLSGVTVNGKLYFDNSAKVPSLTLNTKSLVVNGDFRIGCVGKPFTLPANIILFNQKADYGNPGSKIILANSGSTVELIGAETISWTQLSATTPINWIYNLTTAQYQAQGPTSITVTDDVSSWNVGDQIVVASTDYDGWNSVVGGQSERVTITSISGKTINFTPNLLYSHYGEIYKPGADSIDLRAEVIHLTRNIAISGDTSDGTSDITGFGGHLWANQGSTVHISGAEFFHMGQAGFNAHYPVHFHMGADMTGNYVKLSSFHDTYQRCVGVHGTNNLVIDNNVAFNITCHCFFTQDSVEQGNNFTYNVGIAMEPPQTANVILGSDAEPAVFYITNPKNNLIGNVAVAANFGYWYSLPPHPTGASAGIVNANEWWPTYTPMGLFQNNRAHGMTEQGLLINRGGTTHDAADTCGGSTWYSARLFTITPAMATNMTANAVKGYIESQPLVITTIEGFQAYKCNTGVSGNSQGVLVKGAVLSDNLVGYEWSSDGNMLVSSAIIGDTPNTGSPWIAGTINAANMQGRSRYTLYPVSVPLWGYVHQGWNGPTHISDVSFYNFNNETLAYSNTIRVAAAISADGTSGLNPGRDKSLTLRFINCANRYYTPPGGSYNAQFIATPDTDGTLTAGISKQGKCGSWIIAANSSALLTSNCEYVNGWNSYVCSPDGTPARRGFGIQDISNAPILAVPTDGSGDPTGWGIDATVGVIVRLADGVQGRLVPPNSGGRTTVGGVNYYNFLRSYNPTLIVNQEYLVLFGNASTPSSVIFTVNNMVHGNAYDKGEEWVRLAIPYPKGTNFTISYMWNENDLLTPAADKLSMKYYNYFYDEAAELLWLYFGEAGDSFYYSFGYASYNNYWRIIVKTNCAGSCVGASAYTTLPTYVGPAPTAPFRSECLKAGANYPGGDLSFSVADPAATQSIYADNLTLGWFSYSKDSWNMSSNVPDKSVLPVGLQGNPIYFRWNAYQGTEFLQNDVSTPSLTTQTHFTFSVRVQDGQGRASLGVQWRLNKTSGQGFAPTLDINSPWYINNGPLYSDGTWFDVAIPIEDLGLSAGVQPQRFLFQNTQGQPASMFINNIAFQNLNMKVVSPSKVLTTTTQGSTGGQQAAAATNTNVLPSGSGTGVSSSTSSSSGSGGSGGSSSKNNGLTKGGIAAIVISFLGLFIIIALVVVIIIIIVKKDDGGLVFNHNNPGIGASPTAVNQKLLDPEMNAAEALYGQGNDMPSQI